MKIRELIQDALHKDSFEFLKAAQNGNVACGNPDWTIGMMRIPQTHRSNYYVNEALAQYLPTGQFRIEQVEYPDASGGEIICSWYEEDCIQTERWEYVNVWFKERKNA